MVFLIHTELRCTVNHTSDLFQTAWCRIPGVCYLQVVSTVTVLPTVIVPSCWTQNILSSGFSLLVGMRFRTYALWVKWNTNLMQHCAGFISAESLHSAEIKPAQRCMKLVFYLTYTTMHGNTKLKYALWLFVSWTFRLVHVLRKNWGLPLFIWWRYVSMVHTYVRGWVNMYSPNPL